MSIYVSSDGTSGPKVSINKALLIICFKLIQELANISNRNGISYTAAVRS